MTNTEIIELLNSKGGVSERFIGLEYYDALRLATAIAKVLHSEMELTEQVVDNVKNLLSDDRIAPSVRYWMLRLLTYCDNEKRQRTKEILKSNMSVERDKKIRDVVSVGIKPTYDQKNGCFVMGKGNKPSSFDEAYRYATMREYRHNQDVEKLIEKLKGPTDRQIKEKAEWYCE